MDLWQTLRGPPKPWDIQASSIFTNELIRNYPIAEEACYDFLSYKPGIKVKKRHNKFDISQISIFQEPQAGYNSFTRADKKNCMKPQQNQMFKEIQPTGASSKFNKPQENFYIKTQQTEMIEETPYLSCFDQHLRFNKDSYVRTEQTKMTSFPNPITKFDQGLPFNKNNKIQHIIEETPYLASFSNGLNLSSEENLHPNFYIKTQQTEMIEETPYLSRIGPQFNTFSKKASINEPFKIENAANFELHSYVDNKSRAIEDPFDLDCIYNPSSQIIKLDSSPKRKPSNLRLNNTRCVSYGQNNYCDDDIVHYNNNPDDKIQSQDKDKRDSNLQKSNESQTLNFGDVEHISKADNQLEAELKQQKPKKRKVVDILQEFKFAPKIQPFGLEDSNNNEFTAKHKPSELKNSHNSTKFTSLELKESHNNVKYRLSELGDCHNKTRDKYKPLGLKGDHNTIGDNKENHNQSYKEEKPLNTKETNKNQGISISSTPSNTTKETKITDYFVKAGKSQNSPEDIISPTQSNNIKGRKVTDFYTKAKRKSQGSLEATCPIKQKRIKFCTPYKSQFEEVEVSYEMEELKDENCSELEAKILQRFPVEIAFDIIFREGFCLLSKTSTNKQNGKPVGILLGIFWMVETVTYHYLEIATCSLNLRNFLLYILSPNVTCRKTCYDSKSLFKLLLSLNLPHVALMKSEIFDLLIGTWLLQPEAPPGSFGATQAILGRSIDHKVTTSDAVVKACNLIGVLSKFIEKMIVDLKQKGMYEVFVKIECRMPAILAEMEFKGVRIDRVELLEASSVLKSTIKDCELQACGIMGRRVSLNSTTDIKRALYEELKLNDKIKSPMKESTCERSLLLLKELHPLPSVVLSYRNLQRKNARMESIWKSISGQTLYSIWDQATATGRVMSRSPNLQVISEENLVGFKAGGDYVLLAIDFSHVELRMFAHLAQDCNLLAFLRNEEHIFEKLDVAGVVKDQRETKKIVYTIMQGMGPSRLSDVLKVDVDVARSIHFELTGKFPVFKKFPQSIINSCKKLGYVTSICGRRRNFPNINNQNYGVRTHCEYQAINFCIQASTADFIKSAAIHLLKKIQNENLECHLSLVASEKLILEVSDEAVGKISDLIPKSLSNPGNFCANILPLSCPFPVQIRSGKSWGDLEHF